MDRREEMKRGEKKQQTQINVGSQTWNKKEHINWNKKEREYKKKL